MLATSSLRDLLRTAPAKKRIEAISALTPQEAEALLYDWQLWARENQLPPPGEWRKWLCNAGRGWGKTRTGAEWVKWRVNNGYRYVALVGRTSADVRDVMICGESGLLSIYPKRERPRYVASRRSVEWPNGVIGKCYSAEEPDQMRGPQHDTAWADELASWKYRDAWDQLMFGLRLGKDPRVVITTTPRPTPIIKEIIADPSTVVVRGSTFDNKANLAAAFIDTIVQRYEGTRLGRQELYAEVLDDNPGALWRRADIEDARVRRAPAMRRVVVAIDPEATSGEESAETGIIAAGEGVDGEYYVLKDVSRRDTPNGWARAAIAIFNELRADRIVAEINNGGEMIEAVLRSVDPYISYYGVHASRGKATRAEPIAALYEQGRVHHVGSFPELEDQMCEWSPGQKSPDRMDALVWALTELTTGVKGKAYSEKPKGW